jgi:hypothetical protein
MGTAVLVALIMIPCNSAVTDIPERRETVATVCPDTVALLIDKPEPEVKAAPVKKKRARHRQARKKRHK